MNIPLPEFPGAGNLMGNLDASTVRSKSSYRGSVHTKEAATKTRKKRKVSAILDAGDSARQEMVKRSLRKVRKGKRTKSELTFAGKEVIVLDSDDSADDGQSLGIDRPGPLIKN